MPNIIIKLLKEFQNKGGIAILKNLEYPILS